ncbi:6378_t:CDS:2 [Dentiscutata erythropus]|uniref:6378_t:CDS:1 n=1 Tax=Dentiscutata erythropus TaxID=1348616 RepID=A0A9N9HII9_9GLOM|nr:6378_t:CDS:2 [Dentiscutata erythropus]
MNRSTERYFRFFTHKFWSLESFISFSIGNDEFVEKMEAHSRFYSSLRKISADTNTTQEARDRARKLLDKKKEWLRYYIS